jgi:hypothetical protein
MMLTVRGRGGLGLSGLIISIAIAGCSGSGAKPTASPTAKSGTLSGTALACIGPGLPPGRDNVTVEVDISDSHGQRVARRMLHANGKAAYGPIPFSLTLPVGRYTASTPADNAQTVQVSAGHNSTVTLINSCI